MTSDNDLSGHLSDGNGQIRTAWMTSWIGGGPERCPGRAGIGVQRVDQEVVRRASNGAWEHFGHGVPLSSLQVPPGASSMPDLGHPEGS